MGAVLAGAGVVGPIVGGSFADGIGWRWAFLLNVPLGAVAVAIVWARLRLRDEPAGGRRVDHVGAVLIGTSVIAILFSFGESATEYPGSLRLALGVVAAVAVLIYVRWQGTRADPIVPLALLRDRTVGSGVLLGVVGGVVMIVVSIHIPLARQTLDGASATSAALTLIPLTASVMGASLAAGSIVTRLGRYRSVIIVGSVLTATGTAILALTTGSQGAVATAAALAVTGLGVGLTMQPALLAVQHAVRPAELGTATAATAFFRQIGTTVAIGIALGLLTTRAGDALAAAEEAASLTESSRSTIETAIATNLAATAVGAGLAVLAALAMPDRALGQPAQASAAPSDQPART